MLLSIARWLRRPGLAAAVLITGLAAAAGQAQAQYYPYYAYNPYYSGYACDPYYYPYGCPANYAYAYPYYGYPYWGYPAPVALGFGFGVGRGFHHGSRGGFHRR